MMPTTTKPLPESILKAVDVSGHVEKSDSAFKTISEAADVLDVPQHVLRFWESRFPQIKPTKLRGGRRYYRPADMEVLTTIKNLLYKQGYTIEGAKSVLSSRKKTAPAAETPTAKLTLTDKQHSQLAVIRRELMGLKDMLEPYL